MMPTGVYIRKLEAIENDRIKDLIASKHGYTLHRISII